MSYPFRGILHYSCFLMNVLQFRRLAALVFFVILLLEHSQAIVAAAQSSESQSAPTITKVEPPNWWIGLTPDLMILLSGHGLQANKAACNVPDVVVERTQATEGGNYLFVWLKFGPRMRSGTIVCRITTLNGETSFELPISNREPTAKRFHGLSSDDVLYLIMPDRFANADPTNDDPAEFTGSHNRSKPRSWHGGDLRGIREHLSYLKDLGVTALWLTPVVKNGVEQDYHGYGAVDLYAVDPHLGGLADYKELASALREQRMKLFFDAVPNHVGPLHPWVKKPPLPDWFHGTVQNHFDSFSPVKNYFYGKSSSGGVSNDPFEALADPHATSEMRRSLRDGWFFGVLPDLNTENPMVAKYLLQNSIWWIELVGLDGLLFPQALGVGYDSFCQSRFPRLHCFAIRHAGFRYMTLGRQLESEARPRRVYDILCGMNASRIGFVGLGRMGANMARRLHDRGHCLSTVFDFPMFFAVRDVLLHGASAGRIANVLRQDALYPHPDWLVPFFANHDVTRFASEAGSSPEKLLCAFGLILTLRGIPQLYYGDEIAMPAEGDPDNRRDFPGGWPGDKQNAFTEDGRTSEQQQVFLAVRNLLEIRRQHTALRTGKLFHIFSDDDSYLFVRQTEDERLLIVFNNASKPRTLTLQQANTPLAGRLRATLLYGSGSAEINGREMKVIAPAQSISILSLN